MKEAISPARVDDMAELKRLMENYADDMDAADSENGYFVPSEVSTTIRAFIARTEAAEARAQALETLNNVLSEKLERRTLALQAAEQRGRHLEAGLRKVRDIAAEGAAKPSDVDHLRKTIMAMSSIVTVALLSPAAPERSQGEG